MFAKNQKISHSQLYCQMLLTCLGVFLMSIPGEGSLVGRMGIWCIALATLVFGFYSIYLVRISYVFSSLEKYFGCWGSCAIISIYLLFLWHSGIFLLLRMEQIADRYLLTGVSPWVLEFLVLAVCYLGSAKGLQRRGRMAQASIPLLLGMLCIMFLLSISQVEREYLNVQVNVAGDHIWQESYGVLAMFAPFCLLPFTLKQVEQPGRSLRAILGAMVTLGIVLCLACILLQGTFGLTGTSKHAFPMVDLMAGVGVPGGFIERMDVFWIIFLMFSLLFAIGSVFFYTGEILDRVKKKSCAVWMLLFVWLGCAWARGQQGILDLYGQMLQYFYLPAFILLGLLAGVMGKRRKVS